MASLLVQGSGMGLLLGIGGAFIGGLTFNAFGGQGFTSLNFWSF